jgi:hypothetical protein
MQNYFLPLSRQEKSDSRRSMNEMRCIPQWVTRLIPAGAVVVAWFFVQDNIEVFTSTSRNSFLWIAAFGLVFIVTPLLPYLLTKRRPIPRDVIAAGVVTALAACWTLFILAALAFWAGHIGD